MPAIIYNCKRCKVGRRVEYPVRQPRCPRSVFARQDAAGRLFTPGAWISSCGGGKPTVYGGDPLGLCPSCGKVMAFDALVATTRAEVRCDARCLGARGHTCDCSCGGKNHGAGWAVAA